MVLRSSVALAVAAAAVGSCSISSSNPEPLRLASPIERDGDVHFEPKLRDVEGLVGENVAVSFELVNASDHPVRLTNAECKWGNLRVDTPGGESIPACVLKGGLPSPFTLAPSTRVTLVNGFDGRLACEPGTREECWVRAWIDDASEPVEATIRWRRRPPSVVRGASTDLGEIEPRGTIERRFVLDLADFGRVDVRDARISSESIPDARLDAALRVEGRDVTPPGAAGTSYEIVLRIDAARLPYGKRGVGIEASLRRARLPKAGFRVHWDCPQPFEALVDGAPVGEGLQLGFVKQLDAPVRRVVIHSRDPAHPAHVRAARVEPAEGGPRFSVVVGAIADGDTPLDLAPVEFPKTRVFRGELVVEIDDPRAPEWRTKLVGHQFVAPALPAGK